MSMRRGSNSSGSGLPDSDSLISDPLNPTLLGPTDTMAEVSKTDEEVKSRRSSNGSVKSRRSSEGGSVDGTKEEPYPPLLPAEQNKPSESESVGPRDPDTLMLKKLGVIQETPQKIVNTLSEVAQSDAKPGDTGSIEESLDLPSKLEKSEDDTTTAERFSGRRPKRSRPARGAAAAAVPEESSDAAGLDESEDDPASDAAAVDDEDEEESAATKKKKRGRKPTPKARGRAAAATNPENYNAEALEPDQVEQIRSVMEDMQKKTVAQLKTMLVKNEQRSAGSKQELIERVAECTVLGALPKCEMCGAYIRWDRNTGLYTCPGKFTDGAMRRCSFKAEELERIPWKS